MKLLLTCVALLAMTFPVTAQWLTYRTPGIPRTADGKPNLTAPAPRGHDGHPDLTGLWISRNLHGDLFEAAKVQPRVQTLLRQRAEDFFKDNPLYSCLPSGPGYLARGGMRRIVQNPTVIAILNDDLTYRQIFTDGRALETDPNPTWMGYSVGRWEEDTLVVESAGFNDRTWLTDAGLSHTEALRITERYRRPDFGHLEIDVTFTDAAAYTGPLHWTVGMEFAADTELLEAVCENTHWQQHWVGKASDAERSAVQVAPEILAKYVGVYSGLWGRTPRTVRITLVNGTLFLDTTSTPASSMDIRTPVPLLAQSETLFVGDGLGYQFIREGQGVATHVIEQHVSGAYTYARRP